MTQPADTVNGHSDIVAGHAPPYTYSSAHGYDRAPLGTAPQDRSSAPPPDAPEDSEDDQDLFEDSADDLPLDAELAESNPNDFTKSYNRARRLHDNSVTADQKPKTNPQKPKANIAARIDDQIASLSRHVGKLNLDNVSSGVDGKTGAHGGDRDRADRATSEQVLDPRTRMILLQMINRGVVSEINGCVSTGKEANVYHALSETATPSDGATPRASSPVAIKIFKTAILTFRARSAYLQGEFRFRSGYKHRSSHAMVRMWAEKEFRNLKRLHAAGLPVPEPLYLRAHVLAMRFIGSKKGWSAPLLRDATFSADTDADADADADARWVALYREVLRCMRRMYRTCRLVHADLSEYNMLLHAGQLCIIDVGQAVEHDHPRSLEFLRADVKNVTRFFGAKGVPTLAEPVSFSFIVAEASPIDDKGMDAELGRLAAAPVPSVDEDADTAVFRQQYIPQTLHQVFDAERDVDKVQRGEARDLVYQALLADRGATASSGPIQENAAEPSGSDHDQGPEDEDDNGSSSGSTDFEEKRPRGKRFEDKAAKKEHKAAVKDEKREKRKTKMPKKEKKKLVNNSCRGHKK